MSGGRDCREPDECQGTPVPPDTAIAATERTPDDDHAAVDRVIRGTPDCAPVVWVARAVFGDDVTSGDADWQFVKRHAEKYHDLFTPTARVAEQVAPGEYENRETKPDLTWIRPATAHRSSVLDTASGVTVRDAFGRSTSVAASNARVALQSRRALATAGEWGDLVGAFGGKRRGEERSPGGPSPTRFNDVSRALGGRDRVEAAFRGALLADVDLSPVATLVTPTTDPARYSSIDAAAADLLPDVKCLRKKVARATGGGLPPSVTVPEPTARGVPHAHVVLFGVSPSDCPSDHELHNYWHATRERGQQVDTRRLVADGGTWAWDGERPAGADGCPPVKYLTQGARALATAANSSAADVLSVASAYRAQGTEPVNADTAVDADRAVADETGVDAAAVRRAAWYWGTGLKAATRPSPPLTAGVRTNGR